MPGLLDIIGQALSMPTALQQQKANLQQTNLANQMQQLQTQKLQGLLASAFPDQSQQPSQSSASQLPQQQPPQGQTPTTAGLLPMLSGATNMINAAQPSGGLLTPPQQTTQSPTGPVTTTGLLSPQAQPAGQPPQQPQQPWWLTPPDSQTISQIPLPSGLTPRQVQALGVLSGKEPTEISNSIRAQQLSVAQQRYAPIIGKLETVSQTANPMQMIQADPDLAAAWPTIARNAGIDPRTTDASEIRTALTAERNQLASGLSEATVAPSVPLKNVKLPDGRTAQIDQLTGKETILEPSPLSPVLGADNRPVNVPTAQAAGRTPYSPFAATQAVMQGPAGALDAALTNAGVSIPGGRGGQLYPQKLANLLRANPGKTPEQIADEVRTGQLDFNGAKRSTGQLSQVLASTTAFGLQLEKNLDSLAGVQNAVDATGVPILNRAFAAFKQNLSGGKDIAKYTAFFNAAASEYAKIISGGTGVAAPSEGDMKEARHVMVQAYTSGGLEGLRDALTTEANNKRASYQEGLNAAGRTSTATNTPAPINTPAPAPSAAHPADIQALLKKYGGR